MSGYNIVLKKSLPNSKNIVHHGEYDFTRSYRMLRLKSTRVSFSYFLDKFWAFSMVLFNRLQMHLLNTKAGGEISWRGALIKLLHQMSITSNESNRQPFGSQAGAQSTEPHQPGQIKQNFEKMCLHNSFSEFLTRSISTLLISS